ncbi:MAG TPA: alkaline phosphatase family protein [Verrucomicrobia bacterium]|nr:alkaline phosphatase family protein [Verrucomicrobiota bacterium]HOP97211.1 alkaline phosphatase family protein [Verrucomicrobiota bacterium]HPU56150.1 alkaline phosphatase family protein [Verrucomicrobiota bacterium]
MLKFVLRTICSLTLVPVLLFGAGKAEHVVLLVWDGMRPDFITPEHAPTLHALAQEGVFFANHHSVYCTATIVNGTAMATGLYPHRHGVYANSIYLPDFQPLRPVGAQSMETVRHCDELSGGNYLVGPTIAEVLQAAGKHTAIAGSKTVALMHDRKPRPDGQTNNITVFEGRTLPPSYVEVLRARQGRFPAAAPGANSEMPNESRDQWTTSALLKSLWEHGVPAFSLLWLSEPDFSQHAAGPGSPKALNALKSSDRRLAEVLAELDRRGVRDKTDVFVVSDHGFSTVETSIDVVRILRNAGFSARRSFESAPSKGDILVVGLGGSVSFYVIERDEATVKKLVDFLQRQDFTGVLFTRQKMEGTFTLEDAKIHVPYPPDVVLSMKWSDQKSDIGVPGVFWSDGNRRGAGNHASLSRFDVNNILVAAGPDLKRGFRSSVPSGNTDLAPTILWLLGHPSPKPMDGRVLSEALTVEGAPPVSAPTTRRLEAQRELDGLTWRQYLKVSQVNNTVYLDEGNSESVRK